MSTALKEKSKGEISTLECIILIAFGRSYFFSNKICNVVRILDGHFIFDVRTS